MPGPIPTTDFARDNRRPERLLGSPVRGVDWRGKEEGPDGRKRTREVSTKSLDVWDGTGLCEPVVETGDEMAACDSDTVRRDGAGAIAIAHRQRVSQHVLDVGNEPGACDDRSAGVDNGAADARDTFDGPPRQTADTVPRHRHKPRPGRIR